MANYKYIYGNFLNGTINLSNELPVIRGSESIEEDIKAQQIAEFEVDLNSLANRNWQSIVTEMSTMIIIYDADTAWNSTNNIIFAGFVNKVIGTVNETIKIQATGVMEYLKTITPLKAHNGVITNPNTSVTWQSSTWQGVIRAIFTHAFTAISGSPVNPPTILGTLSGSTSGSTYKHVENVTKGRDYFSILEDVKNNKTLNGNEFTFVPVWSNSSRNTVKFNVFIGTDATPLIGGAASSVVTVPLSETSVFKSLSLSIEKNSEGQVNQIIGMSKSGDSKTGKGADVTIRTVNNGKPLSTLYFNPGVELTTAEMNAQLTSRLNDLSKSKGTTSYSVASDNIPLWKSYLGRTFKFEGEVGSAAEGYNVTVRVTNITYSTSDETIKVDVVLPQARYPHLPSDRTGSLTKGGSGGSGGSFTPPQAPPSPPEWDDWDGGNEPIDLEDLNELELNLEYLNSDRGLVNNELSADGNETWEGHSVALGVGDYETSYREWLDNDTLFPDDANGRIVGLDLSKIMTKLPAAVDRVLVMPSFTARATAKFESMPNLNFNQPEAFEVDTPLSEAGIVDTYKDIITVNHSHLNNLMLPTDWGTSELFAEMLNATVNIYGPVEERTIEIVFHQMQYFIFDDWGGFVPEDKLGRMRSKNFYARQVVDANYNNIGDPEFSDEEGLFSGNDTYDDYSMGVFGWQVDQDTIGDVNHNFIVTPRLYPKEAVGLPPFKSDMSELHLYRGKQGQYATENVILVKNRTSGKLTISDGPDDKGFGGYETPKDYESVNTWDIIVDRGFITCRSRTPYGWTTGDTFTDLFSRSTSSDYLLRIKQTQYLDRSNVFSPWSRIYGDSTLRVDRLTLASGNPTVDERKPLPILDSSIIRTTKGLIIPSLQTEDDETYPPDIVLPNYLYHRYGVITLKISHEAPPRYNAINDAGYGVALTTRLFHQTLQVERSNFFIGLYGDISSLFNLRTFTTQNPVGSTTYEHYSLPGQTTSQGWAGLVKSKIIYGRDVPYWKKHNFDSRTRYQHKPLKIEGANVVITGGGGKFQGNDTLQIAVPYSRPSITWLRGLDI